MGRTFQDRDFLVWEVYPSGGRHGYSSDPDLIFNCLTKLNMRPRHVPGGPDEAAAQRMVQEATDAELLHLLEQAAEIA